MLQVVCVTSEVRGPIYSYSWSVKRLTAASYTTSTLASTPRESVSSEADKWGREASPRPADLGVVPRAHRLRVDGSDRFWRSVLLAVC